MNTHSSPQVIEAGGDGNIGQALLGGSRDAVEHGADEVIVKGAAEPFAGIRKTPSHTQSGNLTGYGIEIHQPEKDNEWDLVSTVSPNYLLVPNEDVVQVAREIIADSPFSYQPRKMFFDGKRFIYSVTSDDLVEEARVGDAVRMGLLFENSYDGSRRFRARLFAERLACANGMISKQAFASYAFKHDASEAGWQEDLRAALSVVRQSPQQLKEFASYASRLAGYTVHSKELTQLRSEALDHLPHSRWGEITDEFLQEQDYTGWGLMNAATKVLWHRNKAVADLDHNQKSVDGLLSYAKEHIN